VFADMTPEARDAMFASVSGQLPVGRIGTVDDVAEVVLLTMTNGFLTGSLIDVDGGGLLV
jgi:hypothetical protein